MSVVRPCVLSVLLVLGWLYGRTLGTVLKESDRVPMERLNLWIDGEEIEQFVGVPMDIFVIREGAVVPYLHDAYFDQQLPVLPPEVHVVRLTWLAKNDVYTYSFTDLRSLDPKTLYDPLISIPLQGYIPMSRADFQMAIPCTGRVTAIASMYIVLRVEDKRGTPIHGSPIKLHLRKRCIAFDSRAVCKEECQHGGRCNDQGQCECRPGFYGAFCQQAVCLPECQNNGTCVSPQKCECPPGFIGDTCQTAVCKLPCQNKGQCVGPEKCKCPDTHYGSHCQYKTGKCKIPCKNEGVCASANVCVCQDGYTGDFCQKPVCRRGCGVHGRCVDIDVCECFWGWRGRYCHKTINRLSKTRRKKRKDSRLLENYPDGFKENCSEDSGVMFDDVVDVQGETSTGEGTVWTTEDYELELQGDQARPPVDIGDNNQKKLIRNDRNSKRKDEPFRITDRQLLREERRRRRRAKRLKRRLNRRNKRRHMPVS